MVEIHRVISISVHYQDDVGNNVSGLSNTIVTGKSGDNYVIPNPDVDGYTYEKTTVPLKGKLTIDQSAVVTYVKNK